MRNFLFGAVLVLFAWSLLNVYALTQPAKVEYHEVYIYVPVTVTPALRTEKPKSTAVPELPTETPVQNEEAPIPEPTDEIAEPTQEPIAPTDVPTPEIFYPTAVYVSPTEVPSEPEEVFLGYGKCYQGPELEFCNWHLGIKSGWVNIKRKGGGMDVALVYFGIPRRYEGYILYPTFGGLKITPPKR